MVGVTLKAPPLYLPEFDEEQWARITMEDRWTGEVHYNGAVADFEGIGWMSGCIAQDIGP